MFVLSHGERQEAKTLRDQQRQPPLHYHSTTTSPKGQPISNFTSNDSCSPRNPSTSSTLCPSSTSTAAKKKASKLATTSTTSRTPSKPEAPKNSKKEAKQKRFKKSDDDAERAALQFLVITEEEKQFVDKLKKRNTVNA